MQRIPRLNEYGEISTDLLPKKNLINADTVLLKSIAKCLQMKRNWIFV
jgi:hypothetical protein